VFGEIDHIGIAVEEIDGALALYRDKLGMREEHRETLEEQGVEAMLLEIGDAHIELIAPIDPDGGVARFIAKRGPGIHHVAYRTQDIEGDIKKLVAAGMRMIGDEAHPGIRDSLAIFVHPKSTGGVLTELVQPAEDH
jgi:methylmalonyl-CoA/ethylmalonyl-CoA epimerase